MSRLNDLSQGISDLLTDSIDGAVRECIDSLNITKEFKRILSASVDDAVLEQINLIDWSDHITDDTITTNVDISSIIESEVQGLVSSVAEDFETRVHELERTVLKYSKTIEKLEDFITGLKIDDRPTLWHRLCFWSTSKLNGLKRILGA